MSEHFIAYHGSGYRVYRIVNGLYRQFVGPIFATPKEAARYADKLDAGSGVALSTVPATPRVGAAGMGAKRQ